MSLFSAALAPICSLARRPLGLLALLLASSLSSSLAWASSPAPPAPPAPPAEGATSSPVEGALGALHGGSPLEAWRLLLAEVTGGFSGSLGGGGSQELIVAEQELVALVLTDLTADSGLWRETLDALQVLRPWPESLAPEVSFRLEHLVARCLRRLGQANSARGVIDRLGYFSDWYVVGPFDNERGSGFDVPYEPEQEFDRPAAMAGKEREVSWRWVPARHHPLARVALHELFRPNTQAVAYLATSLQPRDPGFAELRVGSSGPYKIILNGEVVATQDAERRYEPDQDRHVIQLAEGWNSLLVKLGHEEGAWTFDARLTELNGRPLQAVQCESVYSAWPGPAPTEDEAALIFYGVEPERDETAVVIAGDSPEASAVETLPAMRPGTREHLEALPDDAHAQRLLAQYHLSIQAEDLVDDSLVQVAQRAVAADPDHVWGRYLLARAYEPRGQSRNEMEVNKRLHALDEVLSRNPEHVAALLDMADFSLSDNPIPVRADAMTKRALEVAPNSWDVLQMRARFLDLQGRSSEADLMRRTAESSEEASYSSWGILSRARRLLSLGLPDVALQTMQVGADRDVLDRRLIGELVDGLVETGEYSVAHTIAERAMTAEPFDVDRMLETAMLFEQGDQVYQERGRELVDRALSVCPESTRALDRLVRIEERIGHLDEAVEGLTELLRLDPSDSRTRRHLALLTTGTQERFEEPYRWDAAELVLLPLPDTSANDPLEVLARTVVWRVQPDGTEHQYQHVVLRVLNEGGARMLDVYPVAGAGGGTLHMHNARVLRRDGSVEYAPASRRSGRSYRTYDFPPLSVGDVVDMEWRSDQDTADVFGQYFGIRHDFYPDRIDGLAPTRWSELVVIAPEDVPLTVQERNADGLEREQSQEGDLIIRRWLARDLARPPLESSMPAVSEFTPSVDITTFRDWNHFSTWWWHFIEKEFVTTPAMREKVAELTEGLETERERIEAIVRFVGQEIRYNAWAFGTHGYEPYSAPTIFERRFGDCKDKSILLRQLLAEIDVEAFPVLIKAESPRAEEPLAAAMVGHFNHCIAYVPATEDREAIYLDATADRNPIEYLRADDQGARVLHVGPEGGSLHEIPFAPPQENALRRDYRIELDTKGGGGVRLEDTSNGSFGVRHRYRYGGETGDLSTGLSRELSVGFGAVTIQDVETSELEDISQPVRLKAAFKAPNLWSGEGAEKALRVSLDPLGMDRVAQEAAANRQFEVVFPRPFAQETSALWTLPEHAQVLELPPDVSVQARGLVDYQQRLRETPEGILVERSFRLNVHRIPVQDYGAFRDALQQIRLAEAREFRILVPTGDLP